jgi:hypothetical protein
VPPLRSAANVAELARLVRQTARHQVGESRELATLLRRHAAQLGLDPAAETGRLATATRLVELLDQLTQETDDVVLVELLASADLGSANDTTVSKSITTARDVATALTRTQWSVLDAVAKLTDDRAEHSRSILEQLADAASREQLHQDLIAELEKAVGLGAALLTEGRPPQPVAQPASQPHRPVVSSPISPPAQPPSPGVGPPAQPSASVAGGERVVIDRAGLREAEVEIGELLERNPGKRIRVTWAVEE